MRSPAFFGLSVRPTSSSSYRISFKRGDRVSFGLSCVSARGAAKVFFKGDFSLQLLIEPTN